MPLGLPISEGIYLDERNEINEEGGWVAKREGLHQGEQIRLLGVGELQDAHIGERCEQLLSQGLI
jgi:hypothetical protein